MKKLHFASVLMLIASSVFADSDGLYCLSSGYLAYELRPWSTPDKSHLLNIVRVGGKDGISAPVSVVLDEFQLHGINCSPNAVTLYSWDSTIIVEIPATGAPRVKLSTPHEAGQIPRNSAGDTLTTARSAKSLDIPSADRNHSYTLVISHEEKRNVKEGAGGIIEHKVASKVIMSNAEGKAVKELTIFTGMNEETID